MESGLAYVKDMLNCRFSENDPMEVIKDNLVGRGSVYGSITESVKGIFNEMFVCSSLYESKTVFRVKIDRTASGEKVSIIEGEEGQERDQVCEGIDQEEGDKIIGQYKQFI